MEHLSAQLAALSPTQSLALVTGIAYVVLAARERALCWAFGIVSCALIAWDDFTTFQLYADGVLQLIYVLLGVVGLYQWRVGQANVRALARIHSVPLRTHLMAITTGLLLSIPVSWLLRTYTDAAFGFLDTWTTLMSLYATWLLVKKALENWLYWIVINAIYIYLFFERGGAVISMLYAVYLAVAIYGFLHWRSRLRQAQIVET